MSNFASDYSRFIDNERPSSGIPKIVQRILRVKADCFASSKRISYEYILQVAERVCRF